MYTEIGGRSTATRVIIISVLMVMVFLVAMLVFITAIIVTIQYRRKTHRQSLQGEETEDNENNGEPDGHARELDQTSNDSDTQETLKEHYSVVTNVI